MSLRVTSSGTGNPRAPQPGSAARAGQPFQEGSPSISQLERPGSGHGAATSRCSPGALRHTAPGRLPHGGAVRAGQRGRFGASHQERPVRRGAARHTGVTPGTGPLSRHTVNGPVTPSHRAQPRYPAPGAAPGLRHNRRATSGPAAARPCAPLPCPGSARPCWRPGRCGGCCGPGRGPGPRGGGGGDRRGAGVEREEARPEPGAGRV